MSPTEARAIRATVRTINITALAEVGLTAPQREALATIGIDIGGIIDLSIQLGGNRPTRQNVLDALNSLPTRDRSTALVQCRRVATSGGLFSNAVKGVCSRALSGA